LGNHSLLNYFKKQIMKRLTIQATDERSTNVRRMSLLLCGIFASTLYIVVNIVAVMLYDGYDASSQTVSELSAIGAPTRLFWVSMMIMYSSLMIAFGWGVWQSSNRTRVRIVGALLIIDAIVGLFWPPMHQREVLAAGGGTITDTLHIVFTFITVPLMLLAIGFGSTAFGKGFRNYSIITLIVLIVAGILTGIDGPKVEANLPTPWIGIWERINIGAYMLWVVVFAIMLLQPRRISQSIKINERLLVS